MTLFIFSLKFFGALAIFAALYKWLEKQHQENPRWTNHWAPFSIAVVFVVLWGLVGVTATGLALITGITLLRVL